MHPEVWGEEQQDPETAVSPERREADRLSHNFAEEKAELDWVLAHPEISRSTNLVRFLTFICAKYFDGATRDIREQTIATEALGRKQANFDSHADPIVRVTARTLRKKLETLYKTDGRSHRLQIVLPVGHYVPEFVSHPEAAGAPLDENAAAAAIEPKILESTAEESAYAIQVPAAPLRKAFWVRTWKPAAIALAVPLIFLAGFLIGRQQTPSARTPGDGPKWGEPVWSDEFDGAAQQLPDPSRWAYDLEDQVSPTAKDRQIYCSPQVGGPHACDPHHPSAFLDGMGHLVLRAQKNASGAWMLVRITTKDRKTFQYGRIEARIKMPVGKGLWPSFIMVGSNKDTVGWPASGSIDIAENVSMDASSNGLGPTMIRSTLHGPRYFGSNGLWHDFRLPNGGRVDDGNFHTYGIIWSPGMVQFYVDDPTNVYVVHDATDVPEGGAWVFDHPFYLQMSLGVGGDWAGDSDATTPNPADMLVDYVRVYKIPAVHAPAIHWQSVQVKAGSAAASTVSLRAPSYAGRVRMACTTDSPAVPCSLATAVLDFTDTLSQEDTLTLSTDTFSEKGHVIAPPGHYKVTITATSISGDRSELTMPFDVRSE
ncbi:MAG TPA: family 16 glycosylhydrolase [Terracidiphilus sp.]|nr:family 16 glycosylhydrolase [Terracidiphilus sp.]